MLNKKTVPLKVNVVGADAADADRTVTVPKTITVKGYAAALADISYITAETVDVSEIYEDGALEVKPLLPEGVEVASNSQNLTVKVTVKGMETRRFTYGKEAVAVEGITEDMIASVSDVTIVVTAAGREADISALKEDDFYFVADASGLEPGEHRIELKCHYEGNLSELSFTPAEILVTIERVTEEEPANDESEEE